MKWEITEHNLYHNNWIFAIRRSLLHLCPLRNNKLFRLSFIDSISVPSEGCDVQGSDPSLPELIFSHPSVSISAWFTPPQPPNHFGRHALEHRLTSQQTPLSSFFKFFFPLFCSCCFRFCQWFFALCAISLKNRRKIELIIKSAWILHLEMSVRSEPKDEWVLSAGDRKFNFSISSVLRLTVMFLSITSGLPQSKNLLNLMHLIKHVSNLIDFISTT